MKYTINLLEEKEPSLLERLVYFFLNYLRYSIVIAQLVVIGVFFYRFKIDQSIIDLKESVDQKQEIIQVVLPLLQQANKIDRQTKAIKTILVDQDKVITMFNYLISIFPESITLTRLDFADGTFKLTGKANNPKHLQAFYLVLKKDNKFTNVNLQNIKKADDGYTFNLNLNGFK